MASGDVCFAVMTWAAVSNSFSPDHRPGFAEGTKCCQIGRYFKNKGASVFKDRESFDAIVTWAKTRSDISTVIWTDLGSNCEELRGEPFSIFNAVSYLEKTPQLDKDKAAEYVWNAPQFVKTALREELETKTWFRALKQSSYSAWVLAKPRRKVHSDSSCDNEAKPAY